MTHPIRNRAGLALCFLACICAENIPLMAALVMAAAACVALKGALTMQKDAHTEWRPEDDLRRCHVMLDKLEDPALVARAYRFVKYLYIHRDKKTAPGVTTSKSGKVERIDTESQRFHPYYSGGEGEMQDGNC